VFIFVAFVVVGFVIDSVRRLLDTVSYLHDVVLSEAKGQLCFYKTLSEAHCKITGKRVLLNLRNTKYVNLIIFHRYYDVNLCRTLMKSCEFRAYVG
jgi:hypothetical protein